MFARAASAATGSAARQRPQTGLPRSVPCPASMPEHDKGNRDPAAPVDHLEEERRKSRKRQERATDRHQPEPMITAPMRNPRHRKPLRLPPPTGSRRPPEPQGQAACGTAPRTSARRRQMPCRSARSVKTVRARKTVCRTGTEFPAAGMARSLAGLFTSGNISR